MPVLGGCLPREPDHAGAAREDHRRDQDLRHEHEPAFFGRVPRHGLFGRAAVAGAQFVVEQVARLVLLVAEARHVGLAGQFGVGVEGLSVFGAWAATHARSVANRAGIPLPTRPSADAFHVLLGVLEALLAQGGDGLGGLARGLLLRAAQDDAADELHGVFG